jgi:phosphotransferase system enzyme I (PtsI)
MAGEPLYAMALAGLGIHEFSMNPACIPRVKRVLRKISKTEAELFVEKLLALPVSKDVANTIDREMRARLPEIFGQPLI